MHRIRQFSLWFALSLISGFLYDFLGLQTAIRETTKEIGTLKPILIPVLVLIVLAGIAQVGFSAIWSWYQRKSLEKKTSIIQDMTTIQSLALTLFENQDPQGNPAFLPRINNVIQEYNFLVWQKYAWYFPNPKNYWECATYARAYVDIFEEHGYRKGLREMRKVVEARKSLSNR